MLLNNLNDALKQNKKATENAKYKEIQLVLEETNQMMIEELYSSKEEKQISAQDETQHSQRLITREDEISEFLTEISNLKDLNQTQRYQFEKQIEITKQQIQELEGKLKTIQEEQQEQLQSSESSQAVLKQMIQQQESLIMSLNQQIDELTSKNEQLSEMGVVSDMIKDNQSELEAQYEVAQKQIVSLQKQITEYMETHEKVNERLQDTSKDLAVLKAQTDTGKYLKQLWDRFVNIDVDVSSNEQSTLKLDENTKNQIKLLNSILAILSNSNIIPKAMEQKPEQDLVISSLQDLIRNYNLSTKFPLQEIKHVYQYLDIVFNPDNISEEFSFVVEKVKSLKQTNDAHFISVQNKSKEVKDLLKRIEELENDFSDSSDLSLIQAEVDRQVSNYKNKYDQFKDFWKKLQAKETQQLKQEVSELTRLLEDRNQKIAQLENRKQSLPKSLCNEFNMSSLHWD